MNAPIEIDVIVFSVLLRTDRKTFEAIRKATKGLPVKSVAKPKKPKRPIPRGRKSKTEIARLKAKARRKPHVHGVKSEMDQFRKRQKKFKKKK